MELMTSIRDTLLNMMYDISLRFVANVLANLRLHLPRCHSLRRLAFRLYCLYSEVLLLLFGFEPQR